MRLILALAVFSFGAGLRAEIDVAGRLPEELMPGLRPLIESALENSESALQTEHLLAEAAARRTSARSAILPSLSTSAAVRQEEDQGDRREMGFQERVIYNVTLSQPLYHWGVKRSQKQIGDIQYEIEKLNTLGTKEQILQRARSGYMDLVILKQELDRIAKDLELSRSKLEFQEKQIDVGAASPASRHPYSIAVERDELSQLSLQAEWERTLQEFAMYVSMDTSEVESLIAEKIPDFEVISAEQLNVLEQQFPEGLERDEAVKKKELDVEVEKRRLKIVRQGLRPKVDAQVGLSSNAIDLDGVRREQEFAFFGLRIGWNIFDGFDTRGRTKEALSRLERTKRSSELLKDSVLRGYVQLSRRIDIAKRALAIEEQLLEGREGALRRVRDEVEAQRMAESELDRFEKDVYDASIRVQRARISYLEALSQLMTELRLDPLIEREENAFTPGH